MTAHRTELVVLTMCYAVALACFAVVVTLETEAAFHPWVPW